MSSTNRQVNLRLLLKIIAVVFVSEVLAHSMLNFFDIHSWYSGAFWGTILTVITAAFPTWFLVVRPMKEKQGDFYASILESMTEGFVIQDSQGKIIHYNQAACRILGLTSDQLLGRKSTDPSWKCIHADGSVFEGNSHPAMRVLQTKQAVLNVLMGVYKTQNEISWITINAVPLMDKDNGQIQALTTFVDVSAQEAKNRNLEESQRALTEAQNLGQIGGWSFDVHTGKIAWSEQMFRIFNQPREKGEPSFEEHRQSIHEEDRPMWEAIVEECAKNGRPYVMRFRVPVEGREVWVEARGQGRLDDNKKVVQLSGTCQDISERVKMENELETERSKTAHAAKLSSLGEMAAGVAHEINNPLAIISGTASVLERYAGDPEIFSAKIQTVQKSVDRISKIINGLRKFARVSSQREHQEQSLIKLIDEALILTNHKALKFGVTVSVDHSADGKILCDEVEIEQVLVNLINNGIDAVQDLPERWVNIKVLEDEKQVIVKVMDSGNGITNDLQQKIFNPFFTTKKVGEGTGLGLSISRGILAQHKASIDVDSSIAHTCFVLKFPKPGADENAA